MEEANSGHIFFQDLKINWNNATKEYLFTQFDSFNDLMDSSYLYKNQLKDALEWANHVTTDKDDNSKNKNINNIFSIIGDRGTGKSSFEETLSNALIMKKQLHSGQDCKSVYPLQKIDPTVFDGKLDIVELFVAMLKSEVDSSENKGRLEDKLFHELTSFNSVVSEVITVLKNRRIQKSAFSEKNSGMEVLTNIQNQQNFRDKISELIQLFLKVISYDSVNYSYISLQIDDLDLVPNIVTRQMLHDIVDFLKNQSKLIIFIAYREEQLINSIMDALVIENKNLLHHGEIQLSELREQSANFIEKSLPRPQRVYLEIDSATKVKDILSPFITANAPNFFDQYGDEVTLQKFVQLQVMEQIRLQVEPIDKFEYTRFIFPHSLRGALQYLEVLFKMKNYQKIVELNSTEQRASVMIINQLTTLKDNVLSYKNYVTSKFNEDLSKESFVILKEWLDRDAFSRNIFICSKLLSKVQELRKDRELSESEEIIMNKQSYNSSLGDVFTALETYKAAFRNSEDCLQLIYSIKIMYSVESLIAFIEASINYYSLNEADASADIGNRIGLDKYVGLVRGKIMPDAYYYNDSMVSSVTMLIYSKEQDEFIRKTVYSDIAAKGEIEAKGKAALPYTVKWSQMQYREFFKKRNFKERINYHVDPYSQLTDLDYLIKVIKEFSAADSKMYVFYSMFDLDFFVRKNYSKQSLEDDLSGWEYAFKRVNECFTGDLKTIEEKEMRIKMVYPILGKYNNNNEVSKDYDPLYTADDFIELKKYLNLGVSNKQLHDNDEENVMKLIYLNGEAIEIKDIKDISDFYTKFYESYKKWPDSLSEAEKNRATGMTKPNNQFKSSKMDIKILNKLQKFLSNDESREN